MVIRASSRLQVDGLIADLSSTSAVARDAAVARLIVIGARALQRLLTLATNPSAPPDARVAAFRALEGIADPQALDPALAALTDAHAQVAAAAVGVAQTFLNGPRGVEALDLLTAVALDRTRAQPVRLAAIRALGQLAPATVRPVFKALAEDDDPNVRTAVGQGTGTGADPLLGLKEAAEGLLPEQAADLRLAIAEGAAQAPVELLHRVIASVRVREGAEPRTSRPGWMAARAAAHAVLADRGSRVALYDLRETLESAREPIAVEFMAALSAIGDVSCLEALAAAYTHAVESGLPPDDWWRAQLSGAFRAIVSREGVTRRHASVRRIAARSRHVLDELWS